MRQPALITRSFEDGRRFEREMMIRICSLILLIALPIVAIGPPSNVTDAATPPSGTAVMKPPDLPARLPWPAGETHSLGWRYNTPGSDHKCTPGHAQDCFALDVDNLTTNTAIYPVLSGKVRFAGCATHGWAHYGHIVYIETQQGNHTYGVFYAHLSDVTVHTGDEVGANKQIGRAGETITWPVDGSQGCTSVDTTMGVHLHFALYRDAGFQESKAGTGPHDGNPVIPEPLIGQGGAYENFQWWAGPMTAVDLAAGASASQGAWEHDASRDAQRVAFGQPVRFSVHVQDRVDIKEVHFTAYYPNWAAPSSPFDNTFPSKQIWRILAVCRPLGNPSDGSCTWRGSARDAVVAFAWAPSREPASVHSAVPWLPPARSPIAAGGGNPVSVCISFDIVSTTGVEQLAPNGVHGSNCGLSA